MATGAQGPQGPGAAILTYDANARSNTTPTVLGTAHVVWHETAIAGASSQTCHLSLESYPTTVSGVTGSADGRPVQSRLPIQLSH